MAQSTRADEAATDREQDNEPAPTHDDPIIWSNIEEDTLGTRTFEVDLYDEETFDERRPAYYRTGRTSEGHSRQRAAGMDRAPPTVAVASFMEGVTTKPVDTDDPYYICEEVAIMPTKEELREYKEEFDNRERDYEPHFVRYPFFNEHIVGSPGLAAAYVLVVQNARHADDPEYSYEWDADYEAGEVDITVTRIGESK